MVKRLHVSVDGTVTLQSENDKYKPQTLTAEQARDLQVYGIVHSRITAVPSPR